MDKEECSGSEKSGRIHFNYHGSVVKSRKWDSFEKQNFEFEKVNLNLRRIKD